MNASLRMSSSQQRGNAHLASFSASLLLLLLLRLFSSCVPSTEALVVPQELPSILSLVYSNIPPIKKGTDSRLGFGFRLGNHADFQVLLELGPQKNTRPIGENPETENNFNKRQVSKAQRNHLLRQQLQQELKQFSSTERDTSTSSWLESWSNSMNAQKGGASGSKKKVKTKLSHQNTAKKQPEKTVPEVSAVVAEQSLKQLQLLYQMATSSEAPTITTATATMPAIASSNLQYNTPIPFQGGRLNLGGPAGFTSRPPEEAALQSISELQNAQKSKSKITQELMDVSLETGE